MICCPIHLQYTCIPIKVMEIQVKSVREAWASTTPTEDSDAHQKRTLPLQTRTFLDRMHIQYAALHPPHIPVKVMEIQVKSVREAWVKIHGQCPSAHASLCRSIPPHFHSQPSPPRPISTFIHTPAPPPRSPPLHFLGPVPARAPAF